MSNDVGHQNASRLAFSQALDEEILLISSFIWEYFSQNLAVIKGQTNLFLNNVSMLSPFFC